MKRLLCSLLGLFFVGVLAIQAQAVISFDKTSVDFGTFAEENPIVKTVFKFVNKGDKPLVINQVLTTCGCTVPRYTKEPIAPGKSGVLEVTYNGKGKFPGHFKKLITVSSNASEPILRLYVEGNMTAKK